MIAIPTWTWLIVRIDLQQFSNPPPTHNHFQDTCLGFQNPRWHQMEDPKERAPKRLIQGSYWTCFICQINFLGSKFTLQSGFQAKYSDSELIQHLPLIYGSLLLCLFQTSVASWKLSTNQFKILCKVFQVGFLFFQNLVVWPTWPDPSIYIGRWF